MSAPDPVEPKTCFIAMPITTHPDQVEVYAGDKDHWAHVMETIFVPAVEQAGFTAIRPVANGSHMIHGQIIKHLIEADMVLCDLSSLNPNVLFELGVRTSLNLPIALVKDEFLSIPFDTSGINTASYRAALNGWEVDGEVKALAQHLRDSEASCAGTNPMWRTFGYTITARQPEPAASASEAQLALIYDSVLKIRRRMEVLESGEAVTFESGFYVNPQQVEVQKAIARVVHAISWGSTFETGDGLTTLAFAVDPTFLLQPDVTKDIEDIVVRYGFRLLSILRNGTDEVEVRLIAA